MKRLMILNGPNLNRSGVRQPHIYGTTTLAQIEESCVHHAAGLGLDLTLRQSNHDRRYLRIGTLRLHRSDARPDGEKILTGADANYA
jgi:3-dehydroquinate dehydratase